MNIFKQLCIQKTPISSIENPIFMLLILINVTYGSDTNCRVVFNNFTVGFLNMLVFQTVWRNKNEHKTTIKMKKEEKSVFKFTRNLPTYDYEALHPSRF